MRRHRAGVVGAIVLVLALVAAACGDSGDDTDNASDTTAAASKGSIVVGSTNFTEQLIVAQLYAKALEDAGYDVTVRANLGARDVVQPALQNGELDLVAEYVGTLLEFFSKGAATSDLDASVTKLREQLTPKQLTALEPAPAEDKNALVLTKAKSDELKATKVSDLATKADQLTLGGPPECPARPLCLIGFQEKYGLQFKEFKPLDAGGPITKKALTDGDIDVAVLFSSSVPANTVVLEDDKGLQPVENLIPVIRTETLDDDIEALLNSISEKLTNEELQALNRKVDDDKEDPADVAEQWLKDNGFID
jgi:osmoprotectant transport system substrate-binding protein